MLKFIKHHMTSMENIDIYPIISLTIFTLFFIALLFWVFRRPKAYINEVSNYPLMEDELNAPEFNLKNTAA